MKIPVIDEIISFIGGLAKRWMDAKLVEAEAKVEIAKVRAKAAAEIEVTKAQADIKWDQIHAEGSKTSWKDEFWTIILAVPLVLAFIPQAQDIVREGFAVLSDDVPEWYLYAVGTAIAAAFGVRKLSDLIGTSGRSGKVTNRNN